MEAKQIKTIMSCK